jgi:hypothetical protein
MSILFEPHESSYYTCGVRVLEIDGVGDFELGTWVH